MVKRFWKTLAHLFHPRRSNNHRPRVLHPEAFVYFGLIVVGFSLLIRGITRLPTDYSTILGFASNITPSQVIAATNQERAGRGLEALSLNPTLTQAALAKGQDMMANQYWAHVSPAGKEPWAFMQAAGYQYQVAGENLARDFFSTNDMVKAWMASPTHRANILSPKYSEIGIAVIDGKLEGYETTLVVQMFGSPIQTAGRAPQATGSQQDEPALTQNEGVTITIDSLSQTLDSDTTQPETLADIEQADAQIQALDQLATEPQVLASAFLPIGELRLPPLFTPLQLTKAFFLSLIMLITVTLVYDTLIIGKRKTVRMVGKNLAHILFFSTVAFLVIFFKGGIIG